jgi:hypothetical protein
MTLNQRLLLIQKNVFQTEFDCHPRKSFTNAIYKEFQ